MNPELATFLTGQESASLEALERLVGRKVVIESVPDMAREEIEVSLSG